MIKPRRRVLSGRKSSRKWPPEPSYAENKIHKTDKVDLWGDQSVKLNEEVEIPNEEVPIECQPCFDESEKEEKQRAT